MPTIAKTATLDALGLPAGDHVVRFHVEERLLDGTRIAQEGLDAVARMGGSTYSDTRRRFDLARPVVPADVRS